MAEDSSQRHDQHHIIFFDTECGLCWRSIQFLIRHCHSGSTMPFYFSSLQGITYSQLIQDKLQNQSKEEEGVVVITKEGKVHIGALATLFALSQAQTHMLRYISRFLIWLAPCFGFLYNALYHFIARRRTRHFMCTIPSDEEKKQMKPYLLP